MPAPVKEQPNMNAKELSAKYPDPSPEDLVKLMVELHDETLDIIADRGAVGNSAIVAVFKEQDQKFRAYCRKLGRPGNDAYKIAMHHLMPEVIEVINLYCISLGQPEFYVSESRTTQQPNNLTIQPPNHPTT